MPLSHLLAATINGTEVSDWVLVLAAVAAAILVLALVKKLVKTAIFFGVILALAIGVVLVNSGALSG